MSSFQVLACKPSFNVFSIPRGRYSSLGLHSVVRFSRDSACQVPEFSSRLKTYTSGIQRCAPVFVFGGKGNSTDDNDASPWKSLEKAMSGLKKEKSLEDVLREQMEKKEYYDDGGSGGKRPGGGGGGGGDGFGESEDEGFSGILDEAFQVFMATLGFILLYVYIIAGDEVIAFFKDILRFLARRPNNRFSNMFYRFGRQYQTQYQEDPYALEKAILNTPTWWDSPTKYKRMIKAYLASLSSSDNEEYDSS
ncbi:hypothetical protein DCAR_0206170 [Daucus carota subsp. sativus]|uniref:Uncharacterized protein n=1 Tax=Daucus carota subsp. sativus TaxID=79200 RepID=A0A166D1V1_DAUCS|nr:PREDICTED: uncharacterized protein LOC108206139 [Daucus carota subsp. sativus]WOG86951.1 hypothetical protein DCAR_0206170 [Daucus carota subsp. sativus]